MLQNLTRRTIIILVAFLPIAFFLLPVGLQLRASSALASETNGIIDATDKYAWGENVGWINFGCDGCTVEITDTEITGYAWSGQFGWINLNPTTSGVKNDGTGVLSGSAWSSNLGWIDFTGVTINSEGEFLGYASIQSDDSQINFNCINANSCAGADFKVRTDWRPASVRQTPGGGSSGSRPRPPATPPADPPINPPLTPPFTPPPFSDIPNKISDIINQASDFISYLFTGDSKNIPDALVYVPKVAPISFGGRWNLLPVKAINTFVFAPLPYEVRVLTNKFPELDKTLKDVGVERLNDLNKLTGVSLKIPGLSGMNEEMINSVGAGKIALIKGLPVANFSLSAKKNLPSEFVFARTSGELVDLHVAMSVGNRGEVTQHTSFLPGKTMRLVVKPISSARSVTGYFIFKSATPRISKEDNQNEISRSSLLASALFGMAGLVEKDPEPVPVENKLVLSSFEYTDEDGDGIYTADVTSPLVPGEYEIITVIDYIDPVLGTRQMRMTTVIDPEGYVFEKRDGKETRIPGAIVSLYYLNSTTKTYELWPAGDYRQENPQITDVRGTYSFLVPEGSYYFHVEAPGYDPYQGKVFAVREGSGVHVNIELNSGQKWLDNLDWETVLLIVVALLLVYNLYRNKERDRLLKLLNKNGE